MSSHRTRLCVLVDSGPLAGLGALATLSGLTESELIREGIDLLLQNQVEPMAFVPSDDELAIDLIAQESWTQDDVLALIQARGDFPDTAPHRRWISFAMNRLGWTRSAHLGPVSYRREPKKWQPEWVFSEITAAAARLPDLRRKNVLRLMWALLREDMDDPKNPEIPEIHRLFKQMSPFLATQERPCPTPPSPPTTRSSSPPSAAPIPTAPLKSSTG